MAARTTRRDLVPLSPPASDPAARGGLRTTLWGWDRTNTGPMVSEMAGIASPDVHDQKTTANSGTSPGNGGVLGRLKEDQLVCVQQGCRV